MIFVSTYIQRVIEGNVPYSFYPVGDRKGRE